MMLIEPSLIRKGKDGITDILVRKSLIVLKPSAPWNKLNKQGVA